MSASTIHQVKLPSGESIPALGQGTWHMAEQPTRRDDEVAALRLGIDLGMTLIDTAEMYAQGGAEKLVGEAIAGRRDEVFLVGKVLPHRATLRGTVTALEASLLRLRTDRIDLYLVHWRGPVPLAETVQALQTLVRAGAIRHWGVSNFDRDDLAELETVPDGREAQTDQVLYNLARRGAEHDLLPWCRARDIPIMAYSPIEQGRLLSSTAVQEVAARHEATPAQVALSWVLRQDGVVALPKAGKPAHVRENRAAADLLLTDQDLATLDAAFPPPIGPRPLEML